jgi:hypothetical protein
MGQAVVILREGRDWRTLDHGGQSTHQNEFDVCCQQTLEQGR